MNRHVVGMAVLAFGVLLCGHGICFAFSGQVVTVESSDEQLLLISGSEHREVETAVNEAAARGFRLVMLSQTIVGGGLSGLNCLLERGETRTRPARAYAFVQGLSWNKPSKKVNELARRGYRVLPWAVKGRSWPCWYCPPGGSRFKVLIVMEQSASSEIHEYALLVSASRKRILNKILRHCEQGYRAITFVDLWAGQMEAVMERPVPAGEPIDAGVCGAERYEIVNELPTDAGRDPLFGLNDLLVDLSSRGYRLLASTIYSSGNQRWMLFERAESTAGDYEYVFVEPRDSVEETIAAVQEAGAAGFRLHSLSLPGLMMEKRPGADTKSEYLRVGPATGTELLDAIAAAYDDGFRVVRVWVDPCRPVSQHAEPDVTVLLERQTAEPEESPNQGTARTTHDV